MRQTTHFFQMKTLKFSLFQSVPCTIFQLANVNQFAFVSDFSFSVWKLSLVKMWAQCVKFGEIISQSSFHTSTFEHCCQTQWPNFAKSVRLLLCLCKHKLAHFAHFLIFVCCIWVIKPLMNFEQIICCLSLQIQTWMCSCLFGAVTAEHIWFFCSDTRVLLLLCWPSEKFPRLFQKSVLDVSHWAIIAHMNTKWSVLQQSSAIHHSFFSEASKATS